MGGKVLIRRNKYCTSVNILNIHASLIRGGIKEDE